MRYCIHCGKEIKETADFCPLCGKKQANATEKKVAGQKEKPSLDTDALKEAAKEKISQAKEKGADIGRAGINAVQDGVKAVKDSGSETGGNQNYRKLIIPIAVACVVIVAGIFIVRAVVGSSGGSHSSDEAALKDIIADQQAMGAEINDENGASYEWDEEGRLVGISWNGCSLNGSISFSRLSCLKRLSCGENQLSGLDVSGCKELEELYCSHNQLGKLDISDCTALESLQCSDNSLGELNVGNCTSLKELSCSDNQLKALDVSNCGRLEDLYCDESVKISGCSAGIIHYD